MPPRLPLGDAYTGECQSGGAPRQPDETIIREICNVGYGRGCCQRFPSDAGADAVRFHIAGDAAGVIRVQYILEKDCWPKESGTFEWSVTGQELSGGPANPILRRQAAVFIEGYQRRMDK